MPGLGLLGDVTGFRADVIVTSSDGSRDGLSTGKG